MDFYDAPDSAITAENGFYGPAFGLWDRPAMSENRDLPPLRIRPRPSRILAVFLLATYGVALSIVIVLPSGLVLAYRAHRLKGRTVAQCFLRDVLIVDLRT